MFRRGPNALALLILAGPVLATPAPVVTRYFAGSTQDVDASVRLRQIDATVAFEVLTAWQGPLSLACEVAWPDGSLQRRFRGAGSFHLECADGPVLESPTLAFRSGAGGGRDGAAFETVFALSRCQPPVRVEGTARLRGAALQAYLRPEILPAKVLPLELVCEAATTPAAASLRVP